MQFYHFYCTFNEPAIFVRSPNANQIQNATNEGVHEMCEENWQGYVLTVLLCALCYLQLNVSGVWLALLLHSNAIWHLYKFTLLSQTGCSPQRRAEKHNWKSHLKTYFGEKWRLLPPPPGALQRHGRFISSIHYWGIFCLLRKDSEEEIRFKWYIPLLTDGDASMASSMYACGTPKCWYMQLKV